MWGTIDVTVRFGPVTALESVTLTAEPGVVTAVVGGDGAGKSTLLRVIAGLVAPTEGRAARPPDRCMGFVPTGSGVFGDLTVAENVEFVAGAYGVALPSERVDDLLRRSGLSGFTDRLAGTLSGGERQKLALVTALLSEPLLLILDEPTTGIDPVSRMMLWRLMAATAARGAAVVFSTSYLDEAERAGVVMLLDRGRSLAYGTPDDLIRQVPGKVVTTDEPTDPARAWRHGARWRQWSPDGTLPGELVEARLEDVAIVAALAAGGGS